VTATRHPVLLARRVLDDGRHVLVAGLARNNSDVAEVSRRSRPNRW
jgi:isoaspartyl peptidase/L-asparaginase-like protein (Ntn-hydrolase superfamily)